MRLRRRTLGSPRLLAGIPSRMMVVTTDQGGSIKINEALMIAGNRVNRLVGEESRG
ncbi:hypothetical protein HH1059_05850 [Halorhodospira halochloris]|uniref:Uncharacterized protein n=1 Tax=Halorhodospira halochloris TaxID=1052 RepID=A0A2Z6EZD9_HALHR|nr:hypothetical protein HH1059_05850 [Halorhodospira halochloris]